MEIKSDTMLGKMLQQQAIDNATILNEPMTREDTFIPVADMGETISKYSCTEVRRFGDTMQLCRFIGSKLYKVEFALDVKLMDIEEYFTIDDVIFKQLGVRCTIN